MKYRKIPVVVEATQWFKNNDHPLDQDYRPSVTRCYGFKPAKTEEGNIVRYFRRPDISGEHLCEHCGIRMHNHGWIDTLEGGHIVCPGDWVITGIQGENYPVKDPIFRETYEKA